MEIYVSGTTDVGIKRSVNQDSILVRKIETEIGTVAFACVCDGMGGLQHGELASATLIYAFREWTEEGLPYLTNHRFSKEELFRQWGKIIEECNSKIVLYGQREDINLGTTVTAMLITESEYFAVNVGDSRAYCVSSENAKQITHDHSFIQQEIDSGRMTVEEAENSHMGHILTQCVGVRPDVSPDFYNGKTKKNAVYLLCSDGFRHRITMDEIASVFDGRKISSAEELKVAEAELIELNKDRRESDNISVVTILVK